MSKNITTKQLNILKFIKSEVSKKGYPPSVREIGAAVGLKSTSTVHGHLSRLEAKGYIRRDPTKPRAIEILLPSDEFADTDINTNISNIEQVQQSVTMVPIVGRVSAGQPILAVENIEDTFPLPAAFVDDGEYFMLQITGDSMIEIGIHDHDYVLVKHQPDAKNGEVVIALLDDSATCKTFYKEDHRIRLQPENASLSPIYSQDVAVLGIVKGVYRKM
ncbi:MAG: transcriptional repressor LexA [Clostridiales bacterium]|nr:transcriptional repressor LexA [Clostridiales bacterium]